MLTSDEILSIMAEAYHHSLYTNIDMRKAVDILEAIRVAMSGETNCFETWDTIDEQIGKTCGGACDEEITEDVKKLQKVLVGLRKNFEQGIIANMISELHDSFQDDKNSGWDNWIRVYTEALSLWRFKVCTALLEETFLFPEDKKQEIEKIKSFTKFILHERRTEAYDFFKSLANLETLSNVRRAKLCVVAGEIQLYDFKNFEMAYELFTRAKELAPDETRVISGLGEYEFGQNNIESAKEIFQKVLKKDPHIVDGYTNMGECYERQNNLGAAEEWYKEAIRMVGGNSYGYVKLLRLYGKPDFFETNKDKMFNLYEHIKIVNPFDEYTTALDIASAYKEKGAYEKAYEWYKKAIDLDGTRLAAYISIGNAYMDEGRYDLAYSSFEKALEVAPEAVDPYLNMARLCVKQQQWEKAISWNRDGISRGAAWRGSIISEIAIIKWKYQKKYKEAERELIDELRQNISERTILDALHGLFDEYYKNLGDRKSALRLLNEIRVIIGPSYEAEYQNRIGNLKYYYREYEDAVDAYHKAISVDPKISKYYANLGDVLKEQGQLLEADKAYRKAIELDIWNAAYPNKLGNLLYGKQDYSQSVKYYLQAVNLAPKEALYHGNVGGAYRALEQWNEAEKAYKRAIELEQDKAEYYNSLGNIYFESGRFGESIKPYTKAVELVPNLAVYHANLANSYRVLGRYEEAITSYSKALDLDNQPAYECDLGRSYGYLEQWEKMIEHCQKAVELRRKTLSDSYGLDYYYEYLAEAYFKARRLREFEDLFEKSGDLKDEPDKKAVVYNRIGNFFFGEYKDKEAISHYERAIRLDSRMPIYEVNLGLSHGNLGEWDKMIEHCRRAVELRRSAPTDSYGWDYYYGYLAEAYFKAGRLREFEDLFEKSGDLKDEPDKKALVYNRIGNLFFNSYKKKESISYYTKAVGLDSHVAVFYANLGGSFRPLGQWEDAERAYLRAIELQQENAEYHNLLGNIYFESGKYEKSIQPYTRAIELAPDMAVYHANLGGSYGILGRYEEAITQYSRALELDNQPVYECDLGSTYGNLQKWEEMIKHCSRAVELRRSKPADPNGLDYYYDFLGEAYFKAGKLREFEVLFEGSGDLKGEPEKKAVVYNRIGNLFFVASQNLEAIPYYEKAIELDSRRPIYECNLGNTYGNLQKWEEMIKHCSRAVELRRDTPDPNGLDYYYEFLAEGYYKAGKLREFEVLFEGSGDLKEEPEKKAAVYNRIGNLHFGEYKNKESIPYYMKAAELAPHVAVYHANLGGAYRALALWEEAEKAYLKAIELEPENADYQNRLGLIYYGLGRFEESLSYYTKAIEINPEGAVYHANLGTSYGALGRWREAKEAYTKTVELDTQPIFECDLGRAYGNLGQWDIAIEHYTRALELRRETPSDPYGLDYYYDFLAEAYFRVGRLSEFEVLFKRSGDLNDEPEKKAVVYNRIGNLLAGASQNQEAVSYYEKAIDLDSTRPIYECNVGLTYGNLGQWGKAIEHHTRALELRRKTPADSNGMDYYYDFLAEACFKAGRLREFEDLFEKSGDLKDEPKKKAVIYNRVGNFFFSEYKYREAIPYYERAIGLDSRMPIYEVNLGLSYGNLGQWGKAIEHYTRAVELRREIPTDPNGLDYYYGYLAEGYFKAGRLKEFEELLEASGDLKGEPEKKAVVYNRIGNLYFGEYKNKESIPYYMKATELAPHVTVYHANLGGAYRTLALWEEAGRAYQEATRLEPNNAGYQNMFGNIYLESGDYEKSIGPYKRAVEIDPNVAVHHANLGLAFMNLQRLEESIKAFQIAVEFEPNNSGYHNSLGIVYYRSSDYQRAIESYRKAIQNDPKIAIYRANLVLVYMELGKGEDAEKVYREAIDIDPSDPIYQNDLGKAYEMNGDYRRAAEQYLRALRINPKVDLYLSNLILACEKLKDSDKAISLLESAAEALPDNIEIAQAIERLKKSRKLA